MLELPPEVDFVFADARTTVETRNAYMYALRGAGWTLQSISESSGLTRERVRQIVKDFGENGDTVANVAGPVPTPPSKAVKEPRQYVEPDPEKLARLLALKPIAQRVRSNSPNHREEAEEYTKLIAEVHMTDGVPLYRLAKRLDVSHGALRFRLARYGYKQPAAGSSKVYTPILAENRPTA